MVSSLNLPGWHWGCLNEELDTLRQRTWRTFFRWSGVALGKAVVVLGLIAGTPRGVAALFQDAFSLREQIEGNTGELLGSNVGATREDGEPRHAGKTGGHSVWISWIAPSDGLLTLSTSGSGFDTVLAVYRRESPEDAEGWSGLESVGEDDDDDEDDHGAGWSTTQIGVRHGIRYEIAVDGYAGAVGAIRLTWTFVPRNAPFPVIPGGTPDQAVREGDPVTLSFNLPAIDGAEYRWYRNGISVEDGEDAVLTIPRFRAEDAGHYRLRIELNDVSMMSQPIELQINSEGQPQVLARNKLFDAVESTLRLEHHDGALATPGPRRSLRLQSIPIGVVRGQNGTQVFNTRHATRDPGEPTHCGMAGGASYWFGYECTEDGTLRFDSTGSEIDTILAVYTFEPPLTGYDQLQPVGCDISGANGRNASIVEFAANRAKMYLVVLEGVANARGIARIHYQWSRPAPTNLVPPSILQSPSSIASAVGTTVELSALANGSEPLSFLWHRDGTPLAHATTARCVIPTAQTNDSGLYWLEVSNAAGSATSAVARVEVWVPTRLTTSLTPAAPAVAAGSSVTFATAFEGAPPSAYSWWKDGQRIPDATSDTLRLSAVGPASQGAYSVRAITPLGEAVSNEVFLRVLEPPSLEANLTDQIVAEGAPVAWEVVVHGDEPLALQWLKDGIPIPNETNRRLTIPAAANDHAGRYELMVSNAVGSIVSTPLMLAVARPPVLELAPTPQWVGLGGHARFRVAGNFGPGAQIRWWHEGVECPDNHAVELVVGPCNSSMAGDYVVEISNVAGSIRSSPARLNVVTHSGLWLDRPSSRVEFCFVVLPNQPYRLESTPSLNHPWSMESEGIADETALVWWRKNSMDARQLFLHCEPTSAALR
ncbi:MAG: hypothetical protein JNK85_29025 [Verrucomicrobiales bacterium]|nr:hypothetical protein [Verrucomicrobiales bacterium]